MEKYKYRRSIIAVCVLCSSLPVVMIVPYYIGKLTDQVSNIFNGQFLSATMFNLWLFGAWASLLAIFTMSTIYIGFRIAIGRGL